MSDSNRRRTVIIVILLLLVAVILLLVRCRKADAPPPATVKAPATTPAAVVPVATPQTSAPSTVVALPDEVLTSATLVAPAQIPAGSVFKITWTGPNNRGDYVTLVAPEAADRAYTVYAETKTGPELELTAPVDAGKYELRYVADRSKTVLGRVPIEVTPVGATLTAPAEVVLGANLSVAWTGPNNPSDYITLVPLDTPDGQYGNYTNTSTGSPLTILAPPTAGPAELRYMTGKGAKVLGRRAIAIVMPKVSLNAPAACIAGSTLSVEWSGPNNDSDYITIVARDAKDGSYGNYTNTTAGSPLKLLVPIMAGEAELRYMTGRGAKVLARRPIVIEAAKVTLNAPARAIAGETLTVEWTGPNHPGDYVTIVDAKLPDGQYAKYEYTTKGSPVTLPLPAESGEWEVRYMTGQGGKVLARRAVTTAAR